MNLLRWILLSIMLVAIIASIGIAKCFNFFEVVGIDKALEGFLLFSSITLGFFGTCISILATLINSKVVQDILGNKNYKVEFIAISILTLSTGFIGLVMTVIFQMFMEVDELKLLVKKIITGFWLTFSMGYLMYLGFFLLLIMLLFFEAGKDTTKKVAGIDKVPKSLFNKKQ